jgi:hypothetical protein
VGPLSILIFLGALAGLVYCVYAGNLLVGIVCFLLLLQVGEGMRTSMLHSDLMILEGYVEFLEDRIEDLEKKE